MYQLPKIWKQYIKYLEGDLDSIQPENEDEDSNGNDRLYFMLSLQEQFDLLSEDLNEKILKTKSAIDGMKLKSKM